MLVGVVGGQQDLTLIMAWVIRVTLGHLEESWLNSH